MEGPSLEIKIQSILQRKGVHRTFESGVILQRARGPVIRKKLLDLVRKIVGEGSPSPRTDTESHSDWEKQKRAGGKEPGAMD